MAQQIFLTVFIHSCSKNIDKILSNLNSQVLGEDFQRVDNHRSKILFLSVEAHGQPIFKVLQDL